MNRHEMLAIVRDQITPSRYEHTLRVMEVAIHLSRKYKADVYRAEVAAIFHDYAKYRDLEEMKEIIQTVEHIPNRLLDFHSVLWHAPVGAYLVKKEVGITDPDVLQAISSHTTGRADMTLLEKVIWLADYIEPGRDFPGVEEARQRADQDLNQALLYSLSNTIQFLENKGENVYPSTMDAYHSLKIYTGRK